MLNSITTYFPKNVPIRDVAPVEKAAIVEFNPYFSRNQKQDAPKFAKTESNGFGINYQNYNPLFAVHLLIEAGIEQDQTPSQMVKHYSEPHRTDKNLLAIA